MQNQRGRHPAVEAWEPTRSDCTRPDNLHVQGSGRTCGKVTTPYVARRFPAGFVGSRRAAVGLTAQSFGSVPYSSNSRRPVHVESGAR